REQLPKRSEPQDPQRSAFWAPSSPPQPRSPTQRAPGPRRSPQERRDPCPLELPALRANRVDERRQRGREFSSSLARVGLRQGREQERSGRGRPAIEQCPTPSPRNRSPRSLLPCAPSASSGVWRDLAERKPGSGSWKPRYWPGQESSPSRLPGTAEHSGSWTLRRRRL